MTDGQRSIPVAFAALTAAVVLLLGVAAVDGLAAPALRAAIGLPLRVAALAVGLALVVVGLGGGARRCPPRWTRGEWLALLAVTAAALLLRAWRLDALRVLIDEGNSIDNLFRAYDAATPLLPSPSQYVTTMLYPSGQALSVASLGGSLSSLRLASALLGALTVPALWLLARALFDRRAALLAAIGLATLPVHLHFSRVGLPHIMDVLFGTLALAGVAHGLAGGRRLAWAVGGVALGLTHYGFEAGRWFFTPLVIGWVLVLAIASPARVRAARGGLLRCAAACALTLLPLYAAAALAGGPLAPRLRTSFLSPETRRELLEHPALIGQRLAVAAGVYLWQRENADFYGGDDALLPPLLAPFAVLGTLLALRRPGALPVLIPLWLAAAWLANVAMQDPAVYARWVVACPALALAGASGLHAAASWLAAPLRRAAADAPAAAATALVLAVGVAIPPLADYFGAHIERLAAQVRGSKPYADGYAAALHAAARQPGGDILVISDPRVDIHPPRSLLRLLSDGRDAWRFEQCTPAEADTAYLAALPDDRDHLFFVGLDDRDTPARLASCFALEGPLRDDHPPAPDKRLLLYIAPAGSRRAACAE